MQKCTVHTWPLFTLCGFNSSTQSAFEKAERPIHLLERLSRAGGSRIGPNGDMESSHAAMTSPHWSYSELVLMRSLCEGFLAAFRAFFVGHGWPCFRHTCSALVCGIG